jgi:TctA family transporter
LILGIPGDSVTAIVIGVLLMKNVAPGPEILVKQPMLVYGVYISFVIANLLMLPLGFLAIRAAGHIVRIPRAALLPAILVFSIVGSYAISASLFDVWVMLAMGLLGFVLERWGVPLGPVVLGIVLGGDLEERFIQSWTKSSSLLDLFGRPFAPGGRPWACALAALTLIVWIGPAILAVSRRWRERRRGGT